MAGVDTYLVCGWLRLQVSVAHPGTKGRYTSDHEYLYLPRICATEQPYAGVCMCRSMVACGRNSSEHSWSGRGSAWRCRVCGRVVTTCSVDIHASSHFSTSLWPNVSQNFNLPKLYTDMCADHILFSTWLGSEEFRFWWNTDEMTKTDLASGASALPQIPSRIKEAYL